LRAAVDRVERVRVADDAAAAMAPITPRLAEVLAAVPASPTRGDGLAEPLELLGALILHGENLAARVLRELGVELPQPAGRRRAPRPARGLAPESREVLAQAVRLALELRQDRVGTEHVVLALAGAPGVDSLLGALGVDERDIRARLERHRTGDEVPARSAPVAAPELLDRIQAELARLGEEVRRLQGG
jgi:ATP-dependent Clp protease ATP-binding subunit ClpA